MKSTWRKRKKRFVKIHMESKKKKLKKFIKDQLIKINERHFFNSQKVIFVWFIASKFQQ